MTKPFFISIPHAGERLAPEAEWLHTLPEQVLLCDVDRFVDQLYLPVISEMQLKYVATEWHRYAVDLNRDEKDIDGQSVAGAGEAKRELASGLHWTKTTLGDQLIGQPMPRATHEILVQRYFLPFHQQVEGIYRGFKQEGHREVFHLDAHSMPSVGTSAHRDPGQRRADVVISDFLGKSCRAEFRQSVVAAYRSAGFQVAENWPYVGGGVTQRYGHPALGQHAIQVELNRDVYMDERTKQLKPQAQEVKKQVRQAVQQIHQELGAI